MRSKNHFTGSKGLIALALIAGIFMSQPALAIGKPFRVYNISAVHPNEEEPVKKINGQKVVALENNSTLDIYMDKKRNMHLIAGENAGKNVDFFVFDLQGTLVQNFKMKEKDQLKIAGLAKGKYVYHVFSGDEEKATGQFEIK